MNEKKEIVDNDNDDDDDDDWFKVKEKAEALEEITTELPERMDRDKRLTKAKLAKKLRKKNVLINNVLHTMKKAM